MEDSTTSPVENTEQKSIELEQPQEQTQVSQVEETKVENVCPTVATDNTFITPDPGSEAIPLPYIETSGVSEQNFITEDAEPITNAEDTNYPEENSKDECMPLSVAPSEETNSNMENQPTEKQEGEKVSENVIQAELQEKQASVELQDLDYWELEDDENNMISSEQKQLDSSENIQRVPLESPMENFTVQEFSFPETRVAVGHSDTKPEEAEKTLQYEQQQMEEEIAGTNNRENIKDAYEENEQNSQPLSLPITSPLSESHVTPTDNFDEGKESSTPNFGTSASNDAQESHILQESDNPSLFTEEGFPEQSASYSLTSNDKNEDFGWNESEVSDLKTNEMENSLYNGKEKEKNDQDTVEMEKVETDKGNEPSSMQEDSVKEELLSNQQQQEESKQTESKVVSLGVSSFNNTFESRARLHMLGESQYKEKGWGHVKLQKLADNTASKLTFSVEPSVNIFESNIDTDTKFQRVRAKSVRISGSKEQGKDDFVLQLPDTQIAEELVEFLTVTIEEQTKKGSLESSADGDLSTSRTSSLENQILAQKQAEMERVRQHIAELEKRKALVRQSLQRKAVNSQKTSPVATSTPDSPTVAKLNTMDTPSSVSIPETILHANSTQEEASQPREHREMRQRTDEGVVQRILEQGHENIPVEPKSYEGITVGQEPESMQLESPISKRGKWNLIFGNLTSNLFGNFMKT